MDTGAKREKGEAGGAATSVRRDKARFFGVPPRFFAREQRNGVELAREVKHRAKRIGALAANERKGGNPLVGFPP